MSQDVPLLYQRFFLIFYFFRISKISSIMDENYYHDLLIILIQQSISIVGIIFNLTVVWVTFKHKYLNFCIFLCTCSKILKLILWDSHFRAVGTRNGIRNRQGCKKAWSGFGWGFQNFLSKIFFQFQLYKWKVIQKGLLI